MRAAVQIELDDEALSRLADLVAERVAARLALASPAALESGYLAPAAAADYLGVTRKRVHDLTSAGALVPDGRDGRTPLYSRATLDAYVRSGGPDALPQRCPDPPKRALRAAS